MKPLAFCTIIAKNYLAQAQALAASIHQHHPDATIYIAVTDRRTTDWPKASYPTRWVWADELGIPNFEHFCFKYSVLERSTAVKPYFLGALLDRFDEDQAVYLDPDTWLLQALTPVVSALRAHDVAITPHLLEPVIDSDSPNELDILRAGVYNLGFIALKKSPTALKLLQWWRHHLYEGCRNDSEKGLFVDQRWMDLVPAYFSSTIIVRDPGLNIAYWNLRHRRLTHEDGQFRVNGQPAYFFHFSGFDPRRPEIISRYFISKKMMMAGVLKTLHLQYTALLKHHGYDTYSQLTPAFDLFDNGEPIPTPLRLQYLNMDAGVRNQFGNPYQTHSESSLYRWWNKIDEDSFSRHPSHHQTAGNNTKPNDAHCWSQMERTHDITRVRLDSNTRIFNGPTRALKRLAARILWPIFYQQTQFNASNLQQLSSLHNEVGQLKTRVRDLLSRQSLSLKPINSRHPCNSRTPDRPHTSKSGHSENSTEV